MSLTDWITLFSSTGITPSVIIAHIVRPANVDDKSEEKYCVNKIFHQNPGHEVLRASISGNREGLRPVYYHMARTIYHSLSTFYLKPCT